MILPLLVPLALEAVLGASAHLPLPVALAAGGAIGIFVLAFTARERGRSRHA
ncbi:hypothetical protein H181DRAFT_00892 [Streptomyces sp. WMMB 714]|uniref:hypothetical protein n=1 Tax=Streptomyces sp. WMMB 714 TaxID=1286822 RepID=UPI000823811B|nr:hypothetical protein [Streptomyces sp. WMMB 714]SCK14015.1 hypothetical protein H181DRAFT_00892 [Streptomyces sp. WMMB 714]